jgi:hypothetical protein
MLNKLKKYSYFLVYAIYGIYIFLVTLAFKKFYIYKFQDVRILLDRFLVSGFLGIVIASIAGYFLFKKIHGFKIVLAIPIICTVILVCGYYLFIPSALNLTGWMDIKPLN